MKHCYVYKGTLKFNETGYHPLAAESDTALVGEIGTNVANTFDPELGLVIDGDIGVMNFSKIYSLIRSDFTGGESTMGGLRTPENETEDVSYASYRSKINMSTIGPFLDYLRYYDGMKEDYEFITKVNKSMAGGLWHSATVSNNPTSDYFNSIDFLWNKVIEDTPATDETEKVDRGLGVFKIVSAYNLAAKTGNYGTYMASNLGSSRIINGNPKTKVYFSTAEYDHTVPGQVSWTTTGPERASTIPSYSDILSFGYPFSRDTNYIFEMDSSQMALLQGKDYLSNIHDAPFLTNYLSGKLIDKYGAPVTPGSARFGFMFRSSENETLSSLSSYMPVGVPGNKQEFTTSTGETKYYPSSSIVFRIENPNGANVSVVGNGGDLTIYKYNPNTSNNEGENKTTALYSMRSSNVGGDDAHRYFTYDAGTGDVGTETVQNDNSMHDGGALYGHIFKLPQGDYVLGGRTGTANVYFLAVQGQTEGTIGTNDLVTVGEEVTDVDFLLEAPSYADFDVNTGLSARALFSFKAVFNTASGSVVVDVEEVSLKKYMKITFATSPTFVTYMLTYSRHTEHIYYINGVVHDSVNYTYQLQRKEK